MAVEQEKLEEEIEKIRKQRERAERKCKEVLVGWQVNKGEKKGSWN